MAISKRLKTIADLVTPGYRVADIGTDHGYVPIYLLRQGISPFVIAADLSPGSLEKARIQAERAGFLEAGMMECRLSDGLGGIDPGEVDSIIIAGMGGILMERILQRGMETVSCSKELILSPHRDVQLLRDFAEEHGFLLSEDFVLEDKKKKYHILKIIVQ